MERSVLSICRSSLTSCTVSTKSSESLCHLKCLVRSQQCAHSSLDNFRIFKLFYTSTVCCESDTTSRNDYFKRSVGYLFRLGNY
ncbi:hypothetical protein ANTRET_LOCUS3586 [Anthophora retusa]